MNDTCKEWDIIMLTCSLSNSNISL